VDEQCHEKSKYSKLTSAVHQEQKNPFASLKEGFEQNFHDNLDCSNLIIDDYELISYLDQDNSKLYYIHDFSCH
jgi:hypothetical protein